MLRKYWNKSSIISTPSPERKAVRLPLFETIEKRKFGNSHIRKYKDIAGRRCLIPSLLVERIAEGRVAIYLFKETVAERGKNER